MVFSYDVSPAFFISKHGPDFTINDLAQSLPAVRELGYSSFQVDFEYAASSDAWSVNAIAKIHRICEGLHIGISRFVTHFTRDFCKDLRSLEDASVFSRLGDVLRVIRMCMQTDHVVIPIGPFTAKGVPAVQLPPPLLEQCRSAFERWLLHVVDLVNESHFMADFEIVPGSLFPTLDSFNAFRRRHAAKRIGFNFDTGHAHVMREDLTSVAGRFGASLQGTHLRDNFGTDNLALCPGDGSIDWKGVVGSLIDAKYRGPLTMEIGCPSDKVESEYARARTFIMGIVNSISSSPHAPSHRAPGKREETA